VPPPDIPAPAETAGPPPSRAVGISCQGVSKSFVLTDKGSAWRLAFGAWTGLPRFEALRDVSFDVPKGQFVGILGRNGAGKSTLLRTIGGVYSPDCGRIAVNGDLSGLYELGLAGNPELTGRAYATRLLTVHGFGASARAAMIADIHEFSELGSRFDDPVRTYSAGMTGRLFFATATAGRYEVYLLDEILAVGDQHFQSKCWRRLRDRVSRGASGVLVTHDWAAIIRLCQSAHVLDHGRIVYSGPAPKAARFYLYGDHAAQTYTRGIARFAAIPAGPLTARTGHDLTLRARVAIETAADVGVVAVIERLEPIIGWETTLMSRAPTPVGRAPGLYDVDVNIPTTPLEPGSYQISLTLVMPDLGRPDRRILLDGRAWLDGDGIELIVTGDRDRGFALLVCWTVVA
jgi:lipopolysaccharide transport system ATP-binding protein